MSEPVFSASFVRYLACWAAFSAIWACLVRYWFIPALARAIVGMLR